MGEEDKIEFALMKERVKNMAIQMERFVSHLESEQRVSGSISKRVDQLQHSIDRVAHGIDNSNTSHKWRVETIISIISALTSASAVLIVLFK